MTAYFCDYHACASPWMGAAVLAGRAKRPFALAVGHAVFVEFLWLWLWFWALMSIKAQGFI